MKVDRFLGVRATLRALPVAPASGGLGVGPPNPPGAGFWPLVIAVVMTGLGLTLILRPTPNAGGEAGESRWGKFGISLATLLFYVAAIDPRGYLLATAAMLLVQFRWVESRSWRSSIAIALVTAAVSLILFRVLLKVTLRSEEHTSE